MSVNLVDKTTGDLTTIAGETLWADSPIGTILPYGGTSAPSGWFLCQGQALSRTTYSELFAVIGTAFGSGDGSTTFNLPDFRNKTAMGGGTLGASSAGALPNITGGRDNTLSDMIWLGDGVSAGAIKHGTPLQNYQLPASGTFGSFAPLLFDASESSNLYKNNQSYVEPANVRVNYIIKAKMVGVPADFMSAVDEAVEEVVGEDTGWQSIGSYGSKYRVKNGFCTLFVSESHTINLDANGGANLSGTLPSSIRPSFDLSVPAYVYGYTGDVTWGKTQNIAKIRTDGVIRLSSGIVNDFITEVEFVVTYPIN